MRRKSDGKVVLLNPEGQQRLEAAYEQRTRRRSSFVDHADAYLRALRDEGSLGRYAIPGVDPFEALAEVSERT